MKKKILFLLIASKNKQTKNNGGVFTSLEFFGRMSQLRRQIIVGFFALKLAMNIDVYRARRR